MAPIESFSDFLSLCFLMYKMEIIMSSLKGKESARNARDRGDEDLIPGSGRSPRGGNGHPLQYSCLKTPMDRRSLGNYSP